VGEVSGRVADGGAEDARAASLVGAAVVIWTTPRGRCRQPRDQLLAEDRLRLYRSHRRRADNWAKTATFILADKLAADVFKQARVDRLSRSARRVRGDAAACLRIPARQGGYDFDVPLLAGDHVTDDAGTGFVHTAPGHGREDFEIWTATRALRARGINPRSPTPSMRTARSPRSARLHRQARHQRQGREGRRQRGRDQGAGRNGNNKGKYNGGY
jgi:isoleucyl-tRNA synthetase